MTNPLSWKGFAALTAGVVLLAVGSAQPAQADRYKDLQRAVHRDLDRVGKDENRLNDLLRKRDDQRYRRDYKGAHRTEDQISRARLDLQHDRDLLREDRYEFDHYETRSRR